MYASKRIAYSPLIYRSRNILAALDYNYSVDLLFATKDEAAHPPQVSTCSYLEQYLQLCIGILITAIILIFFF